ncbi:MAG TPA: AmmeMemoRadiSam system protein B [bacterium]|nr:AmmeMemoRadiSam system protein B [bacterium]
MKRRIIILTILSIAFLSGCSNGKAAQRVRPPARAGQFYPESAGKLRRTVHAYLKNAETAGGPIAGQVLALWAPHAGYVYSGQVAANAFRFTDGLKPDAVLILAPAHTMPVSGAIIGDWDAFATPLGDVPLHDALCRAIADASPLVTCAQAPHVTEHAVEVHLPFLQTLQPGVPIIPMVMGRTSFADCERIAGAIVRAAQNRRILLVASSDMSHYPGYEDARKADGRILNAVAELDPRAVWDVEERIVREGVPGLDCGLCGKEALVTIMIAARQSGADGVRMLPYRNSGDISGDHRRVVGYGAAVFYRKGGNMVPDDRTEGIPFSDGETRKLFQIARENILAALRREPLPEHAITEERLKLGRGVFITLTNAGRLRGCIGHFGSDYPLHRIVARMAVAAATQDYRFAGNPVTPEEMKKIEIKISVLSELKKIDSVDEIEIGKHGIWVKQDGRSGTYLPEVATEMGWNREQFLSSCCADKAGLPPDAWKRGADIFVYTSQILSERDYL